MAVSPIAMIVRWKTPKRRGQLGGEAMRTLPLLLTTALFAFTAQVQAADLIVRAADEDGHAISKFEAKGIAIGGRQPLWLGSRGR